MSYTIKKYNGTTLTTIADGTHDTLTSLTLAGPNYVGYGEQLNENLVYLLENFCGNTSPSGENLLGQLWFNRVSQTLNVYTTEGYLPVSGISIGTMQPTSANPGNTWFDTTHNQYYMYDGTSWNLIGPLYTKGQGVSGAVPTTVNDGSISGVTHDIIKIQFGDYIFAIFSDSQFAVDPLNPISGFPILYKGLTLNENLFPGSDQFYSNVSSETYLPVSPTIVGIQDDLTTLTTFTYNQATYANAAIEAANVAINNTITAANISINNTINNAVATLNAQADAIVANTNAYLANVQANIASLSANLAANIATVLAGLDGVTAAWTANAASQQVQINGLVAGAYSNSNVAAYLPSYGGQIAGSKITATTMPVSTSNTAVATTAYVNSVLPYGSIIMWYGSVATVPTGWQLCNGSNGTPDLRDRFVVGSGSSYTPGTIGGATSVALSTSNLPSHDHSFSGSGSTSSAGGHSHGISISITDPGHSHTVHANPGGSGGAFGGGTSSAATNIGTSTSTTGISASGSASSVGDHSHSVSVSGTVGSTGSGTSFSTMPPYFAVCYIMKMY